MLDIQLIRENPEYVQKALAKRGLEVDFKELLDIDVKRREAMTEVEALKAKRNKASAEVGQLKRNGENADHVLAELKELSDEIKEKDDLVSELNIKQEEFLIGLPNMPAEEVRAGGKENNQVEKMFGEQPKFDFEPKSHIELEESLDLIDYERGAKLSGAGFWLYEGDGARLEWALLNYFIDAHISDEYKMLLVPHILNSASGFTAGQFPKFKEDVFWLDSDENVQEENKQFLLPTAETAVVNLFRDEILTEADLPRKYFAYSPCYRKEAGTYGSSERGMIRGHQFNKIEMFQFTKPEDSDKAFEELVEKASQLVSDLGLHFRVSSLAAGDCSASMAKTWDIEVWIPSMNEYKEVSSVSNAKDYQARRGNMRYRSESDNKIKYLHTLNGSGLATSRLFPAILEQNQQEDGSVLIPAVLTKYMGGQRYLKPREN